MSYCIYLRKSRKDDESTVEETLKKHKKILLKFAKERNFFIEKIYEEVVSGETIEKRIEMQKLLKDVENRKYEGVIVLEIERLARGNTIDQGIVAQIFKISNTKIITPIKIYNPNNEFDEEYFEFNLFMSRREYKVINRRLQRGRIVSVKEGNYIGSVAPFGYEKIKKEKRHTLKINEEQAEIVRLIFNLYTEKNLGILKISKYLNDIGVKPLKSDIWTKSTIQNILKNPVYIGKIKWNERKEISIIKNGEIKKIRPKSKDYILVDGIHKNIIENKQFEKAQEIMKKHSNTPLKKQNTLKNCLAGIIKCGYCGRNLVRRPYNKTTQKDTLICTTVGCKNISSPLYIVEEKVFEFLEKYIGDCKIFIDDLENEKDKEKQILKSNIKKLEEEEKNLKNQLDKVYNFLEEGIYSKQIFLNRFNYLDLKLKNLNNKLQNNKNKLKLIEDEKIHKKIENEIQIKNMDIQLKNKLLKQTIEYIIYKKEKNCRWHNDLDDFELIIFPKVFF